ncbi:hypothetical protein BBJ28_00004501 [Nothophytophthora sp. Chile5]|nr:hypothetical protein BBJ28_00004501 [Nothophytophthora sp. Chile5]
MAKKKSKRAAAASSTSAADGGEKDIAELFALLQQKGAAWYDREREGIALIEGFQSALVACRDAAPTVEDVSPPAGYAASDQSQLRSLSGLGGNVDMDPWLAEDLYQQVQQLPRTFEELLGEMYALQSQARELST